MNASAFARNLKEFLACVNALNEPARKRALAHKKRRVQHPAW
jgi:hypothetical protein